MASAPKPKPKPKGAVRPMARGKKEPGSSKTGPAPWEPTEQDRIIALMGAACGMTQETIAKHVNWPNGVSVPTLKKRLSAELETGAEQATLQVAGNLFKHALGRDAYSVTAAIFWMKTRARWSTAGPMNAVPVDGEVDDEGKVTFTLRIGERDIDNDAGPED